ncbi:MAG: hypothetical protein JSV83_19145 [Desulfobacterales bacterium]|nr:MAG: hypothetical protein JSV83_19145 [Desulfobacterales bacterium]
MADTFGWVGKILRVDLSERKTDEVPTDNYAPQFLGGRGLGAKIYWEAVTPEVGVFDRRNVLILATGPLQGTLAPTSGRFMVLGKAPQTGPVESYNRSGVGGHWAPELKWAGFDALAIQGKAEKPIYLWIHDGKAEFKDASHLWGLDTYQTQTEIWKTHGNKSRAMVIGRAGENLSRIACILTDSGDASGQCGFGGVMGSKNLKAIVVRGTGSVRVAKPDKLADITRSIHHLFARKPASNDPFKPAQAGFKYNIWGGKPRGALTLFYGELLDLCNNPTSGYTQIPDGCYACPIACRTRVKGPDITNGVALCAQSFMYMESLVLQPEKGYSKITWQAAKLADLYGINAYDLMAIIPWLGDCYREGVLTEKETDLPLSKIGSWEFIEKLLRKIAYREGIGDLLAEGGQRAAGKLGEKAQQLSEFYYPRGGKFGGYREHWAFLGGFPSGFAIPQLALMWVLDTRDVFTSHNFISQIWGAADTIVQNENNAVPDDLIPILKPVMKYAYGSEEAAEFFSRDRKKLNWKWAPQVVKRAHERAILKDSYVVCDIAFPYVFNANSKDHVGDTSLESQLFSAVTGHELTEAASYQKGDMLCTLERAIAVRDGRTRKDDVLRDKYHETADAADRKYERADLEKAKDQYYQLRGWDVATGIPKRQTLEKHGLKDVAEELQRRKIF